MTSPQRSLPGVLLNGLVLSSAVAASGFGSVEGCRVSSSGLRCRYVLLGSSLI